MMPLARRLAALDPENPPTALRYGMEGDAESNFACFAQKGIAKLDERTVGNWDHLARAYLNAFAAGKFISDIAAHIEALGGSIDERADAAGVNIVAASNILHSALLLHLRPEPFHDRAAMILVRSALECTGRGAAIAEGIGDEVDRWNKNKAFGTGECMRALAALTCAANAAASPPTDVYAWLCNFTHMNSVGLKHFFDGPTTRHQDTYAAIAYAAWTTAVLAERVVGATDLASWPTMPAHLPW